MNAMHKLKAQIFLAWTQYLIRFEVWYDMTKTNSPKKEVNS